MTLKVHPILRPFGLPNEIEPTKENIQKWIKESKPGFMKCSCYVGVGSDIATLAGIILWIIGYKKDSKASKWGGGILTLGGLATDLVAGIRNGVLGAIFSKGFDKAKQLGEPDSKPDEKGPKDKPKPKSTPTSYPTVQDHFASAYEELSRHRPLRPTGSYMNSFFGGSSYKDQIEQSRRQREEWFKKHYGARQNVDPETIDRARRANEAFSNYITGIGKAVQDAIDSMLRRSYPRGNASSESHQEPIGPARQLPPPTDLDPSTIKVKTSIDHDELLKELESTSGIASAQQGTMRIVFLDKYKTNQLELIDHLVQISLSKEIDSKSINEASVCLSEIATKKQNGELVRCFKQNNTYFVRAWALTALADKNDSSVVDLAKTFLKTEADASPYLRGSAILILSELDNSTEVLDLFDHIANDDKDENVRKIAKSAEAIIKERLEAKTS